MKKRFSILLLAFLISGCTFILANLSDGRYDNNNLLVNSRKMQLQKISLSLAKLITRASFSDHANGTMNKFLIGNGVVLKNGYVLSVEHTISIPSTAEFFTPFGQIFVPLERKTEDITYLMYGEEEIPLKLLFKDEKNDISLFKIPEGFDDIPAFPYKLGNSEDLRVGNYVYLFGNPENFGINVRQGIVSALKAPEEISALNAIGKNSFMLTNGLIPGDSGTPIVAIRDGEFELVGITQGTFVGKNVLGWAIRINIILELLSDKGFLLEK